MRLVEKTRLGLESNDKVVQSKRKKSQAMSCRVQRCKEVFNVYASHVCPARLLRYAEVDSIPDITRSTH